MKKSRQILGFGSLCAISLLVWWHVLVSTFSLAITDDEYTNILLILPLSLVLILVRRDVLLTKPQPNFQAGLSLLVAGVAALIWGKWAAVTHPDVALSLRMLGLVIWWMGAVVFCFGIQVFRSLRFPLFFLLWMVPLPGPVLAQIVTFLQLGSAHLTRFLFILTGIPVSMSGVVLSVPGIDIEVARECSSIRSSLMLMVASMVLAHLFLHSPWRKASVVIAAIPLSVVKNAIRIFTLTVLATHVDPRFLTGSLHHQGGVVFFLLALSILGIMIWLLRKTEGQGRSSRIYHFSPAGSPATHQ